MVTDRGEIKRTTIVYSAKGEAADPVVYGGELHGRIYRVDPVGRRGWPGGGPVHVRVLPECTGSGVGPLPHRMGMFGRRCAIPATPAIGRGGSPATAGSRLAATSTPVTAAGAPATT